MQFFLFLAFVIAVLFVIIAFQNPGDISLIFVNREMSAPTALILHRVSMPPKMRWPQSCKAASMAMPNCKVQMPVSSSLTMR